MSEGEGQRIEEQRKAENKVVQKVAYNGGRVELLRGEMRGLGNVIN